MSTGMSINEESLYSELSEEEKLQISKDVLERLDKKFSSKLELCSKLQINNEKCKIDYEQYKFKLEKEIASIQEKLENESKARAEAKAQSNLLESKCNEQIESIQKLNEKVNSLSRQLEICHSEQEIASSQASAMTGTLESRAKVIEELKHENNYLEENLAKSQKAKNEAMVTAEEASSLQIQLQFKERKLSQENDLLSKQMSLLQQQLAGKSEELLNIRHENSTSILSLQSEINHLTIEVKRLREEKEAFETNLSKKSEKIEELLSTLNEHRLSESRLEETFNQELNAQKKIATIYEAASNDQNKRCEELEKGIDELRQLLQEASEQYGALEKAKSKAEEEAQNALTQSGQLIKDLQDENLKANDLLKSCMKKDDMMSSTFPAASAASQLMSKGLTLSQLYSEYLNTSEKLFKAEEENKRLGRYVEQILEEIHEKGPYLMKQKEDYERALETINALHTQVEDSIEELEKQRVESEECKRRSGFLGRENDRLTLQIRDLGKQVAVLVVQVEAARAGLPPPPINSGFDEEAVTSSDVIDQQLVSFRDVSELQEQNRKLLASLRELTEKLETAESDAVNTKIQQLENELSDTNKELSEMRFSREKMQTIVDNLTSQRDMYRTFVNQEDLTNGHTSVPTGDKEKVEKLGRELQASKEEASRCRKELNDYREERDKNQQLERTQAERIKAAFDKTKNENVRLVSHAEYNDERLKTLESNWESSQRLLKALEEKNATLREMIARHEASIESMQQSAVGLSRKLGSTEVEVTNLRGQLSLVKESEALLKVERESLHRNKYSQSMIQSSLDAIQNRLDQTHSQNKMSNENKISDLTEQCARLKAKIEANTDIKEANLKANALEEKLKASQGEIEELRKKLTVEEQKAIELRSQMQQKSSPRGLVRSSPDVSKSVRELQVQLSEERAKTTSLSQALQQARSSVENLKGISQQHEQHLKQSSESNKDLQKKNEELIRDLKLALKKTEEVEIKLGEADENEKALRDTMNQQLLKITEDLEGRENELEDAQKKFDDAKKAEQICHSKMIEQQKLAQEMQDRYEKEVMLHGADLQTMSALKQNASNFNSQLDELRIAKEKAQESLSENEFEFKNNEKKMKEIIEKLKSRLTELEEQNKSVLDQFMAISEKIANVQTKLGESGDASFTEEEARSTEQQQEVLKFLRREREIASSNALSSQAEAQRLGAQMKSLEIKLQTAEDRFKEERQKNQSSSLGGVHLAEIMKKANAMETFMESNKLLRDEMSRTVMSLKTLEKTHENLKVQISPLQEENRNLVSKVANLSANIEALENVKTELRARIDGLVEKLNKSKPEDMIELQRLNNELKTALTAKETEIINKKTQYDRLTKNQQGLSQQRQTALQNLQTAKEELRKAEDETKKSSAEKVRLSQQLGVSVEKIKNLDAAQQKSEETLTQLRAQVCELKQKDDLLKKQVEGLDTKVKELEAKKEDFEKKTEQLRRIAQKYKKMSEPSASDVNKEVFEQQIKTLEEKVTSQTQEIECKKHENEQLEATNATMEERMKEKDSLLASKTSAAVKDNSGDADLLTKLAECESLRDSLETKVESLEAEKVGLTQQIEALNKKLQMQQKILENLQKQSASGSKVVVPMAVEKPVCEAPPTANIKPMAVPAPVPVAAASPRGPTPGGSRSIPTASIRPMAPSVLVTPLIEAHDGAVSSTVTLPQATVTPTPVVPTCTPTQATLTATISPMAPAAPQDGASTSSSDDLVSQALATLVAPVEERGQKRRLEAETEEDEEAKRARVLVEEEEEEEALEGEPSSSRHVEEEEEEEEEEEVLVVSSGEEEMEEAAQPSAEEPSGAVPEPPSSSRQLAPFVPQYEEDDRTVPSTPTLFVPRSGEGAAGGSSPQVPSQGPFEFSAQPSEVSHSDEGLSQIAEGGNIDVTRMDLSQLEQRSPAVEQSVEESISSSGGESEAAVSGQTEANEAEAGAAPSLAQEAPDAEEGSEQVVSSQGEDTNQRRTEATRMPITWEGAASTRGSTRARRSGSFAGPFRASGRTTRRPNRGFSRGGPH